MLKNKKFLIGFLTCAGLALIMAHDNNNNHNHNEYADSYHSYASSLTDNYAEEGSSINYSFDPAGLNSYDQSGWDSIAIYPVHTTKEFSF